MATCPGGAPTPNEPVTVTPGITVTPAIPQPIYSSNGVGNPIVSWNPTDEFCSLQFEATPGNEFVVPTTSWLAEWKNPDATTSNDAGGNPALAAGFGVTPLSGTPVTGPATSGPIAIGTNTVTITIVSGTIRVSMGNGSLFGYNPGDPVSNAVIKYQWANPVNTLQHLYFDNGADQTPKGLTNYQLSLASVVPPPLAVLTLDCGNEVTGPYTATLKGNLTAGGAGGTLHFEYQDGTNTISTPLVPTTGILPQQITADLTGLAPCVNYGYRLVWADGTNTVESAECVFHVSGWSLKGVCS